MQGYCLNAMPALEQSSGQLLTVARSPGCLATCLSCLPAVHGHLIYMAGLRLGFMARCSPPVCATGGLFP